MNLKKYLSVGHVVEDMNHLHGRYVLSKSGMIPRFEQRKLGAVRTHAGNVRGGGRHIVFSSKSQTGASGVSPMESLASEKLKGGHRMLDTDATQEPRTQRSRRGIYKRVHAGSKSFMRQDTGTYQPDLFEKIIPVEIWESENACFVMEVEHQESSPVLDHVFPEKPVSVWRRIKQALSRWLRQG